jgi:hypothetical protein
MTAKRGVFACGDAVTGAGDVTTAMSTARIAATFIHKYLRCEPLTREYPPVRPSVLVEPVAVSEAEAAEATRPLIPARPAVVRRLTFDEVELGLAEEAAVREARRCLRCDWELQKQLRLRQQESVDREQVARPV